MNRFFFFAAIAFVLCVNVLSSCGNKRDPNGMTEKSEEIKEHIAEVKDSTVHVILESADGNSLAVVDPKSKHNIVFDISQALANKAVYGEMKKGDSLNIVAAPGSNIALSVMNVTNLMGRWHYLQTLKRRKGFELANHEVMSSIGADDICYCNWKLVNNTMFFYYVGIEQVARSSYDFQVDTVTILSLSRQKMQLRFRDTVLVCERDAARPLKWKDLKKK